MVRLIDRLDITGTLHNIQTNKQTSILLGVILTKRFAEDLMLLNIFQFVSDIGVLY